MKYRSFSFEINPQLQKFINNFPKQYRSFSFEINPQLNTT